MHEMSIAIGIVDIVIESARQDHATHVEQVEIEIGQLTGILPDFVQVCLKAACRGTIAEGASFCIRTIPGKAQCMKCHACFDFPVFMTPCPICGSYTARPVQGSEMKVVSLTINDE
jgi:hydrogenase nickel incorporation protein HypA/HybF